MHRFNVLIEVGSFGLFSPGIVEGDSRTPSVYSIHGVQAIYSVRVNANRGLI